MTEPTTEFSPTTVRRAASLILHYSRGDLAGANQVIAEVGADTNPGRSTAELLLASIGLLAPGDPETNAILEGVVLTCAGIEAEEPTPDGAA